MKRRLLNLLAVVSLLLASGCIYIPVPVKPPTAGGPFIPTLFGNKDSGRPLHIGVSRAKAVEALGTPLRETRDRKKTTYTFAYLRGYWVGFLIGVRDNRDPPFDEPRYRYYTAVLKFDRNDNLQSYKIRYDDDYPDFDAINEMMEGDDP